MSGLTSCKPDIFGFEAIQWSENKEEPTIVTTTNNEP